MERVKEHLSNRVEDKSLSIVFVILLSLPFWATGFIIYGLMSELFGLILMWCGAGVFCTGLVLWMKKNL